MAVGKLKTVVLDAPDIARLSAFYSELAGWTQRYADHEWVTMTTGDGWRIGLQSAPDHVPPQWPDASHPQQAHLDLRVPDLAAGTQKAVEVGAELVRQNERWNTLTDPAGYPFDLCLAENNETTTLMGVMLDCSDAKLLSTFYSDLLGKLVTYEGDGVAMIGEDGDQLVMFHGKRGNPAIAAVAMSSSPRRSTMASSAGWTWWVSLSGAVVFGASGAAAASSAAVASAMHVTILGSTSGYL